MEKTKYAEQLSDPRWQKMRLKVFERDEWKCCKCRAADKTLHAHHTFYREFAEGPWDCDMSSLVTLCEDCHARTHADIDAAFRKLSAAMLRAGFQDMEFVEALAAAFNEAATPLSTEELFTLVTDVHAIVLRRPRAKPIAAEAS